MATTSTNVPQLQCSEPPPQKPGTPLFTHNPYSEDPPLSVQTSSPRSHRAHQRLKQICFGKRTWGYAAYSSLVPKQHSEPNNDFHPSTPRSDSSLSKRKWEKSLVQWRKQLHLWDDLFPSDIQPPSLGIVQKPSACFARLS